MNLTKDLHDYLNIINQTFNIQQFNFKVEKYGCLDKCTQINQRLNELNQQLKNLVQSSKSSSLFNETHLKFNKLGNEIEATIRVIDKSISKLEKEDFDKYTKNSFEKKVVRNAIELLKDKVSDINVSYQKFLKTQGDLIRHIEKRKANLVNTKNKRPKQDDLFSSEDNEKSPFNQDNEKSLSLQQMDKEANSSYQKDRSTTIQSIEKAMGDLTSLFNRITEMVYRQRNMVERISDDTDVSLTNMTMAESEILKLKDTVKDNRRLMLKIFLIIIFFVVFYIVFLSK